MSPAPPSVPSRPLRAAWGALGLAALALSSPAADPGSMDFFESRVRPVLVHECYDCHGPDKQKGGLRLDFRDGLRQGGDSGPAIVPGDPAASLLVRSVRHEAGVSPMPDQRPALTATVIADLTAWIRAGAPDPRDQPAAPHDPGQTGDRGWARTFATRAEWWSFQPIQSAAIPAATEASGAAPVDRFLAEKWRDAALPPAPPAAADLRLRRLTWVLTGLPPSRAEREAFLADANPGAWERAVDRLLASPRFGERWARHWMDLVRYAETHGSEGDPEIPFAWRYRDYLVRAFNQDVPLDQLVREHVAGDLLESPRLHPTDGSSESILGTAQLRFVEHGFQPVDTLDEQVKTIDNQIDVLTKAFQGLTVSCARCHDHKFDPVSQRDYFALYGILASTRPALVTIDAPQRLQLHRERLQALQAGIRSALGAAWSAPARELDHQLEWIRTHGDLSGLVLAGDEEAARLRAIEAELAELQATAIQRHLQSNGGEATAPDAAAPAPFAVWSFDTSPESQSAGVESRLSGGAEVRDGRLVLNGSSAFLQSGPLPRDLTEKTLEAWVIPASFHQRGGGVLSVERADGSQFDSIVLGEQHAGRWMAGSEVFRRTRDLGVDPETTAGRRVHLAITYAADGTIALFRNGEPYGAPYRPAPAPASFRGAESRILIGMRHTGGGNAWFAGEVDEVRVYDRALSPAQVRRSHQQFEARPTPAQIAAAFTDDERTRRRELEEEQTTVTERWKSRRSEQPAATFVRSALLASLPSARTNAAHVLRPWCSNAPPESGETTSVVWPGEVWRPAVSSEGWLRHGPVPPVLVPEGTPIPGPAAGSPVTLLPAGFASHALSTKHHGVLHSPTFVVKTSRISILALGGGGARARLIPDQYPLGNGNIFPQTTLDSTRPTWFHLDVAYRKDARAYLEFTAAGDVTARDRAHPAPERSWYGVFAVVFHDGTVPLPSPELALRPARPAQPPSVAAVLAAWERGDTDPAAAGLVRELVGAGLLPVHTDALAPAAAVLAEYRQLEAEIPVGRRAPGVWEGPGADAALMARGDPRQPRETVARGFLELVPSAGPIAAGSGRRQLAEALVHPDNPLTARVLANRIWLQVFGRGLVATPDNFGRLGERPTHPELLDYLALRLVEERWSLKAMVRELVLSRAFQAASEPSPRAREADPANRLWSHAPVRRMEAESIRDTLLALSGRLESAGSGPGDDALAGPRDQRRRSLYLTVRRNSLSPFLEAFDAPRPFTTLGRRDTTNVPAQALALLNDPFVLEMTQAWGHTVGMSATSVADGIRTLYLDAFSREPLPDEVAVSSAYLASVAPEGAAPGPDAAAWGDLAHALVNLKEFIYVR